MLGWMKDKLESRLPGEISITSVMPMAPPLGKNWTWNNRLVQIGKGVRQGYILSPCLFNLYAEYIMRNAGLDEAQTGIKIAGRNINTSDIQITPLLWQKVEKN